MLNVWHCRIIWLRIRTQGPYDFFYIVSFTLEWIFAGITVLLQLQAGFSNLLDASCALNILLLKLLCLLGFFSFCSIRCIQGQVNKELYSAEVLVIFLYFVFLNKNYILLWIDLFNCAVLVEMLYPRNVKVLIVAYIQLKEGIKNHFAFKSVFQLCL